VPVQSHIASQLTIEDAKGGLSPVPSQSHFLVAMSVHNTSAWEIVDPKTL